MKILCPMVTMVEVVSHHREEAMRPFGGHICSHWNSALHLVLVNMQEECIVRLEFPQSRPGQRSLRERLSFSR